MMLQLLSEVSTETSNLNKDRTRRKQDPIIPDNTQFTPSFLYLVS